MKKGQVTIINLIALIVAAILLFAFIPVLQPIIDHVADSLNATPNDYTPLITSLLYMIPFFFLLFLIVTGFNYAIPRREGG